ncbi:MAG: YgiQ family radical SAM protein [Bacteroidales bacterium]|nr:YgiQ family radical SAM protein [Bacteroidales bacterium]
MTDWLPVSADEVRKRGWSELDIIIVTGDAYVDHPAFGAAVIGRVLERQGYKVAILPQPNWRDDLRDFRKLGKPRLFFGVTAGAMDSMVNHYTAQKRLRHDDAYTAGGAYGFRPDYAVTVYSQTLKNIYPDTPVVLGGIEASLRRITHYDYWSDTLKPSVLVESGADFLVYGMGEQPIVELANCLNEKVDKSLRTLNQIAYLTEDITPQEDDVVLYSHEECLSDKRIQAKNFVLFETASNKIYAPRLLQKTGSQTIVINPPHIATEGDMDMSFDLPYTREPHPRYKKRGEIPAYKMIKSSVNIHRGCFGGCSFCTISAHQGKQVQSRSEKSIIREIEQIAAMPNFRGVLTDLGGPSANMYGMKGKDLRVCEKCSKPSCIYPIVCKNLNVDYKPLASLYKKVLAMPQVKKCFIGSGVRYDMLVQYLDDRYAREYAKLLIKEGTSGRLKVAPEHTEDNVLKLMRKSSFNFFKEFKKFFDKESREGREAGGDKQLVPYFIASHPGCTMRDMKSLTRQTRALGYRLEQVQNFTPTPLTLATEMYYTELNPYTMERVYVAKTKEERARQMEELLG